MVIFTVVAYERWSLTRSGRLERVDCISLKMSYRRPGYLAQKRPLSASKSRWQTMGEFIGDFKGD